MPCVSVALEIGLRCRQLLEHCNSVLHSDKLACKQLCRRAALPLQLLVTNHSWNHDHCEYL
jgi:hypothetical protein